MAEELYNGWWWTVKLHFQTGLRPEIPTCFLHRVATLDVAVVLTENVCCFTHDLVAQLVFEQHTVGISVVRDNRKHGQMNRKIR